MHTATIARADNRTSTAAADLRSAYLEAATAVAELDLDGATLWRRADGIVADLTAAAYRVTAAVTGGPPGAPATNVPPVVRVRELAVVQGHLFAALDRHPSPAGELLEEASRRVRRLGRQLRQAPLAGRQRRSTAGPRSRALTRWSHRKLG